jgi:hypothetical protein
MFARRIKVRTLPITAAYSICLLLVTAVQIARSEEIVPAAVDEDLQRVVIRQAPKGRYAMYGGLTRLPNHEILCVYKVGSLDPKTGSPWSVRDETIVWARSTGYGRKWPEEEQIIYQDRKTRQENCCGTGLLSKDGTLRHPFYILNADYEKTPLQDWGHLDRWRHALGHPEAGGAAGPRRFLRRHAPAR